MKAYILSFILLLLIGCSGSPLSKETIVTDNSGYKYRLVEASKPISNGISNAELWERFNPLDTNRWYIPVLNSKLDGTVPVIFNSLTR